MNQIFDGDEWWFDTCVGKITDINGKLSEEEIIGYLSELRKIYDNEWYREFRKTGKGIGPCPISLIGGIQSPEFSILRLGQNLKTLGKVENLDSELVIRLQQFGTFLDASIEVEIGACFVEDGYQVELYPILSSGKKCDMRVKIENDWIYIEITHLKLSERENRSFKLSSKLMEDVHGAIPDEVSGLMKFTKPLSPQCALTLLENIVRKIKKEYTRKGLPIEFTGDTFKVELRKREKGRGLGIEGLSISTQKDEGRHLIKRVLGKYKQLPEQGPGIIIVNPAWLLTPQTGEGMADRLKGQFSPNLHTRVSGLIFVNKRAERSGMIKPVPLLVINPYAKRGCDNDMKRLTNALFRYPEWM